MNCEGILLLFKEVANYRFFMCFSWHYINKLGHREKISDRGYKEDKTKAQIFCSNHERAYQFYEHRSILVKRDEPSANNNPGR